MELSIKLNRNKKPKDFAEVGEKHTALDLLGVASQSEYWSRLLDIVPNPDKVVSAKGSTTNELYDPLLYDAHVSSCVQSRKSAVLSMEWGIDMGQKETKETEFINKIFYGDKDLLLDGYNVPRQMDEMLDAAGYGFKPMEIYWRYIGDQLIATDVVGKPQDWFGFDPMGLLKYKGEFGLETGETMMKKKFLIIRQNATSQNPYGNGYLSKCYWPVVFKKGGFQFWTRFAENYGAPYIIGKPGRSMTDADIVKFQGMINNLHNGGRAVLDADATIETIQTGSPSSADIYKNLIHFLNAEISKAVLSQTLTTEQGDTGSYSMSQTHLEVMQNVVDADKRMIEYYYNQLIKWIIDFNFESPEHYPEFTLQPKEDLDAMLERDIKIVQTGHVKLTDQRWRKYLDEGDYELIEPRYQTPSFQIHTPGKSMEFAEKEALEKLMEQDFNDAMVKLLEPVIKMVEAGKSYSEIEKKLMEYFPKAKTKDLEEVLESINLVKSIEGFEEVK